MRATSATGERTPADAGFTLLEMLVVVGVLGLVSGVAFPTVRPALSRIAAQAMRRDEEVTVAIAPTPRGYG